MEANLILHSSLLEIIFEERNKAYGAYDLRETYNKRMTSALLTMFATVLVFVVIWAISHRLKNEKVIIPVFIPDTQIRKIKEGEIKFLPTPKLPKQIVSTIKFPPPNIVKDPLVKDSPPDIKQLESANIDLKTVEGTKNIDVVTPPSGIEGSSVIATPVSKKTEEKVVFGPVEIDAEFPGGPEAWQRYIRKEIMSKLDEFSDEDYGTCIVRFIVDKEGNVSDVKATTMAGTKLAEIVVNTIRKGPNWIPAMQNGHFVIAWRIQPVTLNNPNQ